MDYVASRSKWSAARGGKMVGLAGGGDLRLGIETRENRGRQRKKIGKKRKEKEKSSGPMTGAMWPTCLQY
jgi:hypothetical protein